MAGFPVAIWHRYMPSALLMSVSQETVNPSSFHIATGRQGVTYRPDTWHHGLTVLDRPGRFAVFLWRDGGKGDEEFVPVPPFTVRIP